MRIFAMLCCCCLLFGKVYGQSGKKLPDSIFLSSIQLSQSIDSKVGIFIDSSGSFADKPFRQVPAASTIPEALHRKLPPQLVGKYILMPFTVCNDLHSPQRLFILPGFYVSKSKLYKRNAATGQYEEAPVLAINSRYDAQMGKGFELAAGETGDYLLYVDFIKTTVNTLKPIICFDYYIPQLLSELQHDRRLNIIITYIICGIMLMMIFYSLANYYTNRSTAFLYYAAYSLLLGTMFFFKAWFYRTPLPANYLFESYFDFLMQGIGTFFYFLFLQNFLQSKKDFPLLHAILHSQMVITACGLLLFSWLHFFSNHFVRENLTENLVKYAWSFSTVFLIGYAFFFRSAILRYVAIGHCFLFVGGLLSLFLINSTYRFSGAIATLMNDSLFWYEVGVLFELVFFLVALSYKTKQDISARAREKERLLLAVEKDSIERKMVILAAQQEERNRISADMHDELGSGVTAIRLLSELVKAKMKDNTAPEIEKISQSANELIGKMNTIIWTMKSANDSIDNLIAYVRNHAAEFFDNTDIVCQVIPPDTIPPVEISGEKRRNIFLCIKESLNNIVKHANASRVEIFFSVDQHLQITIKDNGRGLNTAEIRLFSNGISNMRKRMENIGGSFSIDNHNGTIIVLRIPLQE